MPYREGWEVWFHIDPTHPLSWDVLRHLVFAVNGYEFGDAIASLFPVWDLTNPAGRRAAMMWSIRPEIKRLDAELFADYLRDRLPEPADDPLAWRE